MVLYCVHPVVSKFVKILILVRVIFCLKYLWAVEGSLKTNRRLVRLQLNILHWCSEKVRVSLLFPFAAPQRLLNIEASRSHSDTPQSVQIFWTSDQPDAETSTWQHTRQSQQTDMQAAGGIRTHNPSNQTIVDLRLRPRGHWDRQIVQILYL